MPLISQSPAPLPVLLPHSSGAILYTRMPKIKKECWLPPIVEPWSSISPISTTIRPWWTTPSRLTSWCSRRPKYHWRSASRGIPLKCNASNLEISTNSLSPGSLCFNRNMIPGDWYRCFNLDAFPTSTPPIWPNATIPNAHISNAIASESTRPWKISHQSTGMAFGPFPAFSMASSKIVSTLSILTTTGRLPTTERPFWSPWHTSSTAPDASSWMMSTGPITQAATAFQISSKHPKSSSPDRHYMIMSQM